MSNRISQSGKVLLTLALLSIFRGMAAAEPAADKPNPKTDALDAIRALAGTWTPVAPPEAGKKSGSVVFRVVSGDSAVIETMFPGTDEEMINMYTLDGDSVMLTHYCAMGNQPHMRLTSSEKGVLKFEFVDGGNLKSRAEAHMDSVELTVNGDRLTEKWSSYRGDKVTGYHTFEFKRQK